MIGQINEELFIKDARQQLTIREEIWRRQLSEEAEELTEEFRQRQVDEAATKSMKTFKAQVWGGCTYSTTNSWTYPTVRGSSSWTNTRALRNSSSLSTLGGWRTIMDLQPTTTKAGGDARGDGDTKELSGGRKQKDVQSLKEWTPPPLGKLQQFLLSVSQDCRHEVKSKIDFHIAMDKVNISCGLWHSKEQPTH